MNQQHIQPYKKLTTAATGLVLVGALGLAAACNPISGPAPGTGAPVVHQSSHTLETNGAPVPVVRVAGSGSDGAVRLEVSLGNAENGERRLVSTIRNLSKEPIRLVYECDNLTRLNGLRIKRDCEPLPEVTLEPGRSGLEELTLKEAEIDNPTAATLVYKHGSRPDPVTLRINLEPDGPPGPVRLTASDVVDRLKAAGLEVKETGESSVKLFGAKRVDTLSVQGKSVQVYVFDDMAAAQEARKVAADPQANTVSWAEEPQFIVKENLLIGIVSNDKWITKQVIIALDDGPPPIRLKPHIPKERALELAKAVNSSIAWEASLQEEQFDATFRGVRVHGPIWIVEGKDTYSGGAMVLYLDAKTGREVTRVQVAAPGGRLADVRTPEAAVQRYFALTAEGNYEAAWTLLHPVAQKPNPSVPLGVPLAYFYAQGGKPGPKLKAIVEVKPPGDGIGTKDPNCMCFLRTALVTVQLDDGTQRTLHVAEGPQGTWGMLWQLKEGLR